MRPLLLRGITRRFHRLSPSPGHVAHALLTLSPVAVRVLLLHAAPRLACVKPAASVHPEPGSNSSLYILIILSLSLALVSLRNWRSFKVDICYNISVLACTFLSVFSMNFFKTFTAPPFGFGRKNSRSFPNGIAKVHLFFEPANYFSTFFFKKQKEIRVLFFM